MTNLEELKQKALAATPGTWHKYRNDPPHLITIVSSNGFPVITQRLNSDILLERVIADANYVISANPSVVLELIERIEKLEADLDEYINKIVELDAERSRLVEQNYSLACAVEDHSKEREQWMKQEPVAWFDRDYASCIRWKDGLVRSDFVDGQSLYTSPVSSFKVAADWLRNNYQAYANIDSICDAMIKSGYSMDCAKPVTAQPSPAVAVPDHSELVALLGVMCGWQGIDSEKTKVLDKKSTKLYGFETNTLTCPKCGSKYFFETGIHK